MIKRRINIIIFLASVLALTACGTGISQTGTAMQATEAITTSTLEPTVSITPFTPIFATASPQPTERIVITPEPAQLTRWMEYQDALAQKFLPTSYSQGTVLCEWELLGQSGQEVYVWAFCQASGSIPSAMSAPAVIYLGADGVVKSVEVPGSGSLYASDVRRLFPTDVQEKIFAHSVDVNRMKAHIYIRLDHPEPPLIVLSATSVP